MSSRRRASDSPAAGFTLIEILVAFAVVVLLLGIVYRIFSTALGSASVAEDYSRAVLLAESGLELFGTAEALTPGDTGERIDGRFERHASIQPRPDLLSRASDHPDLLPYEIEVTVTWRAGRRPRTVSLSTIRLGPPP
jgi:general secretion pathway protein I